MHSHTYLIIGGGMAAAAVRGIREVDAHGSIGLIGEEGDPPYKRPPLSKQLWRGGSIDRIWSEIDAQGVTPYLGRTAATIDPANKQVTDTQGTIYRFDKLLLATMRQGMWPSSRTRPWAGTAAWSTRTTPAGENHD